MPFWFTICHCGLIVQPCLKLKNTKINIVGKWRTLTSDKAETSLTSNYNFFPRFDIQNLFILETFAVFHILRAVLNRAKKGANWIQSVHFWHFWQLPKTT